MVYTHAGPEIAVASTKAFLTQLVACYLVALYLAQVRGIMYGEEIGAVLAQLQQMPAAVDQVLHTMEPVRAVARELAGERCVLFLGRHVGFPVALEGALKLKELAYMHAEGFAAGELKHGPIALIEPGLPVVVLVPSRAAAACCTTRSFPTSRRSAPAGPGRSSSPRRATTWWGPSRTR